ncbi:MAG TPA: hypothetical protein DCG22_10030, partial [Bacteroidetes bacterium]|nr:hypothetical protein [Bacteroidota bacterium]
MNLKHLILVCVMLCSFSASAQLIQLSGIVAEDRTGYPLPFATVHVLGTYRGTVSSANGFFSLVVAPNDSIRFSSVGYESRLFVVPDTLTDVITSIGVFLPIDTMQLETVEVYPWPTRDDFADAFLALQLANHELRMGPIPGIKTVVDTVPPAPTIFNPITLFYEEIIKP